MEKSLTLSLKGEPFTFDCRRVVHWPRRRVLLAADLHWGKTQYLRRHGIAVGDQVFEADLDRLAQALEEYQIETFIVLGDLIHHEKALSRGVIEKVARFRDEHPCELILVKGNHDRYAEFPESWGVVEEQDLSLDGFHFSHDARGGEGHFQFSGHLHPMMRLRAGYDEVRLPSFILGENGCRLPAFSHLTGGQDVKLEKGEKAVVLMPDGVELFER